MQQQRMEGKRTGDGPVHDDPEQGRAPRAGDVRVGNDVAQNSGETRHCQGEREPDARVRARRSVQHLGDATRNNE